MHERLHACGIRQESQMLDWRASLRIIRHEACCPPISMLAQISQSSNTEHTEVQSAIQILDTPHAMAGVAKLLFSALSAAPAMLSSADLSPTSSSPGKVAAHEAH